MAHDPHDTDTRDERVDRLILAYLDEVDAGREPDRRTLIADNPDLAEELTAFFADQDQVARLVRAACRPALAETTGGAAAAVADDLPAAVGGYRLLRLLGAGGMGRVYEAEGAGGQRVAVKLLAPGLADSPTTLERFRQEGRLASRLTHPRRVFVHTADQDGGRPYIVMELMSGATLKDLVEGAGPLEAAEAVARILDVIEGLQEAHHAGVLHRDVKPANCYLDAGGRVKVGDFGLSRSLAAGSHLTRTGGFVGTPLFASPEQLKGERLDARTDVYSVAATLYYLLTGQAPFQHADGATVIARVVSEPAPPPRGLRPDLPPALEEVVLRGLERPRERRFPDLAAFRAARLAVAAGTDDDCRARPAARRLPARHPAADGPERGHRPASRQPRTADRRPLHAGDGGPRLPLFLVQRWPVGLLGGQVAAAVACHARGRLGAAGPGSGAAAHRGLRGDRRPADEPGRGGGAGPAD